MNPHPTTVKRDSPPHNVKISFIATHTNLHYKQAPATTIMPDHSKEFKRPPKKYAPKGMTILYEDRDIIVVDKESGLLTMGNERESERTAYNYLNFYVSKGNPKSPHRIYIVHRLDRETSGVLLFAKSPEAKSYLQKQWSNFSKFYYAAVEGNMPKPEGTITSRLVESGVHRMYATKDPEQGKEASTHYKVIKHNDSHSLLELNLLTGKKHQIRVHLSDSGCPIIGDKKYGAKQKGVKGLYLHSASLTFTHPYSKKEMTITAPTPAQYEKYVR